MMQQHTIHIAGGVVRNPLVRLTEPVTLDFLAGEHIAIVGPNGAGKSTLIKILGGIYKADSGEIRMHGTVKNITSAAVNTKYIAYKILAVYLAFGTSLSASGPGTSALIKCIESSSSRDVSTITKTRTPIPPIQCVRLLQKDIPIGRTSISVNIVEPVVVKPDTVSKNASR